MAILLSFRVVVGLAVLGGLVSLLAMVLQARGRSEPARIVRLNRAAYAIMGASVLLFIVRGLLLPPAP